MKTEEKCLIVEEIKYDEKDNKVYVGRGNLEDWKKVPGLNPNIECSYDVRTISVFRKDQIKSLLVKRAYLDRVYCDKIEDFDKQLRKSTTEFIPLNNDIIKFLKGNL